MASLLARQRRKRGGLGESGQTSVEYLMLLALVVIVAYLVITGPLSRFTNSVLLTIYNGVSQLVANGEWPPSGDEVGTGTPEQERFSVRPLHLQ